MWSLIGACLFHGCILSLLLLLASLFGWIAQLDAWVGARMSEMMGESFAHRLPAALAWLMAVLVAFGLPALLLTCAHAWQRFTVWFISLVVLALWIPVLSLSAHHPDVALVWLAAAAAGLSVTVHLYRVSRQGSR